MKLVSQLSLAFSLALVATTSANAAAMNFGEGDRAANATIKKMAKNDQIPTIMTCRNAPDAGNRLKPQVAFKSAPNRDRREWRAYAYYGDLNWKPANGKWQRKYEKHFGAPASGRRFNCSLWYGSKGSLGKSRKSIW